jgi:hypothetical protein
VHASIADWVCCRQDDERDLGSAAMLRGRFLFLLRQFQGTTTLLARRTCGPSASVAGGRVPGPGSLPRCGRIHPWPWRPITQASWPRSCSMRWIIERGVGYLTAGRSGGRDDRVRQAPPSRPRHSNQDRRRSRTAGVDRPVGDRGLSISGPLIPITSDPILGLSATTSAARRMRR